jgi:hypothetical protein
MKVSLGRGMQDKGGNKGGINVTSQEATEASRGARGAVAHGERGSQVCSFSIMTCACLPMSRAQTDMPGSTFASPPHIEGEGDRSGNCVAGTVVDGDMINLNLVEFDSNLLNLW